MFLKRPPDNHMYAQSWRLDHSSSIPSSSSLVNYHSHSFPYSILHGWLGFKCRLLLILHFIWLCLFLPLFIFSCEVHLVIMCVSYCCYFFCQNYDSDCDWDCIPVLFSINSDVVNDNFRNHLLTISYFRNSFRQIYDRDWHFMLTWCRDWSVDAFFARTDSCSL